MKARASPSFDCLFETRARPFGVHGSRKARQQAPPRRGRFGRALQLLERGGPPRERLLASLAVQAQVSIELRQRVTRASPLEEQLARERE